MKIKATTFQQSKAKLQNTIGFSEPNQHTFETIPDRPVQVIPEDWNPFPALAL